MLWHFMSTSCWNDETSESGDETSESEKVLVARLSEWLRGKADTCDKI